MRGGGTAIHRVSCIDGIEMFISEQVIPFVVAKQTGKPGRPRVLQNPAYIRFWVESDIMEKVRNHAQRFDVSLSEVLRVSLAAGVDLFPEIKRKSRASELEEKKRQLEVAIKELEGGIQHE